MATSDRTASEQRFSALSRRKKHAKSRCYPGYVILNATRDECGPVEPMVPALDRRRCCSVALGGCLGDACRAGMITKFWAAQFSGE